MTAPATAQNATALRRTFRRWADTLVDDDTANDLTLAVYEALANAADHAFPTPSTAGSLWLHATVADSEITITITDNGTWQRPTNSSGRRGRGLALIHKLTEAHVFLNPQGTMVRLHHQLSPQHIGQRIRAEQAAHHQVGPIPARARSGYPSPDVCWCEH